MSSPPVDLGIPENYLPPEVIIDDENAIGPACDLWALGCTLFEIRRQMQIFYMVYGKDELLTEMVQYFGRLPEKWWSKWEARPEYFNEEGQRINLDGTMKETKITLEAALRHEVSLPPQKEGDEKKVLEISEEEIASCHDLLTKLFQYDPEKRLSAVEVVGHEWLKT